MPHIVCTVTNDLTYDQRMQRIGRSLARAGYELTLVGRQRPGSRPLQPEPFRQVRLRCFFDKGKLFYLEYNLRLLAFLLTYRFDAVCAVDLDTLAPAFLWARLRGRPCIYDAHEYFTEVPEVVRRPAVRTAWRALARLIIPRLRHACTVGPALAAALTERYGIPFTVVRNLPEAQPAPPPGKPAGPPVILYQGALNEGRGLEAAITAMQAIEDAELWLAGEGDCSRSLRELAARLGVTGRVHFLGFVLPADLPTLTRRAAIGLNLLENRGLSYYFSLANKAFDYIQAGLPSIQMDFPEYRRLNEEHDVFLLLDDLSPAAVADAIRRLLHETELRQRLRQNCLHARHLLTWEQEEAALLAFYRQACSDSPADAENPKTERRWGRSRHP